MTEHRQPRKTRGLVSVRADASNVAALVTELNKAFAEFKTANDERLKALEKGKADVVTDEKVERINGAVSDVQALLDRALKDASAERERVDALEAAASRLKAGGAGERRSRDVADEARRFFAGMRGLKAVQVGDADVDAYERYEKAFAEVFRGSGTPAGEVLAALQVGGDPAGGYWVPTERSNDIKRRLFETSQMRALASVVEISTDSIAFPIDSNDATSGGFVGETESRPETATPTLSEQTIFLREQYAMPLVTQKMLDMAVMDVEAWLIAKIVDKMTRVENDRFVNGNGVAAPRGFMDYASAAVTTDDASRSWGVLQYVPTGASAGFPTVSGSAAADPDALITTIAKLNPGYRQGAVWAMSRATEAVIRKLKDADGRYLVGMGDLRDNALQFSLLGYPIVNMEDMDAVAADSFSAAFGNFRVGYQIVDGRGTRIARVLIDPFTTKGQVKFYVTKWVGGDVVNFDAIKLLKFGAS